MRTPYIGGYAKWYRERNEEIARQYKRHGDIQELCYEHNLTADTIAVILKRYLPELERADKEPSKY